MSLAWFYNRGNAKYAVVRRWLAVRRRLSVDTTIEADLRSSSAEIPCALTNHVAHDFSLRETLWSEPVLHLIPIMLFFALRATPQCKHGDSLRFAGGEKRNDRWTR